MHTWLPIHVEIHAEKFVIIVNHMYQAYEYILIISRKNTANFTNSVYSR